MRRRTEIKRSSIVDLTLGEIEDAIYAYIKERSPQVAEGELRSSRVCFHIQDPWNDVVKLVGAHVEIIDFCVEVEEVFSTDGADPKESE